ncbi:hypothetical protein SAMN05421741_11820 [Paenimyroides ummariense]|uniref:Uncharacterized protein n=1 Tax=Paenimyroides ummariense TaxID=913024 RepID=A0A1I5DZH5_9FLAO|nr:hypothetical protein [Paenimyroides ummariense]SFO04674.1 hypothetical protein SAMN05421741_11820 [Paenimyroides ummariense]
MGLAQINIRFRANLEELSSQLQNAQREIKKQGEQMQKYGKTLSTYVTLPLLAAGTAAFSMAADFEDALGATDQTFKKSSDAVQKWAEGLPTYYGIAKKEALEYSNMMGSMLVNIGNLTEQEAAKQSSKLIELAGDLTAMYGGTTADAVRALTGALKGNNTMLDNYGMAANDAMVKTKAMEMGLLKQGQTMDLATKQAATLALIYEQSAAAQGQAAREANGASGSMRAFKTELQNLGTEFGQVLLPVITEAIGVLNGFMKQIAATDSEQKKWIVGIAAVAAAVGPVLVVFGSFMAAVPNIISGFKTIRTAVIAMNTAFMANPIIAVTAAITALVAGSVLLDSRLSSLTNAQKELDEVTKKATQSISSEVAETRRLVAIAQNKKLSDEERTRALDKLIAKSGEHFGKLNLETIGTNAAKKATDAYTASLLKNARIKAAQEKLVEVQKRKIDLELGVSDEADPSVWQTIGSRIKSSFYQGATNSAYLLEQWKAQAKNTKVVSAELTALEKKLQQIIGVQDTVTETVEDYTPAATGAAEATGKLKKAAEDLGVVGSEKWMQAQISAMEEQKSKLDVTSEAYKNLGAQIDIYKNTLEAIQNQTKAPTVTEGSEEWYQREIQLMEEQVSKLDMTTEAYRLLSQQIAIYKKTLEMAQTIPTPVMPEPEQGTVDWYNYHINKLKEARDAVGITIEEYKRLSNEINILETTFKMQVDVEGIDKIVETKKELEGMQTIASGVSQGLTDAFSIMSDGIVGSLGDAENGMDRFKQAMIKTVIKVIAMALSSSIANAIQGGTQSGAATGPGAIVAIPTMIATLVGGVMGAFAAIPKFADGGIVSGPVLGLMGEYAGARNNPEVIAPLNKLKDLIQPSGGATNVTVQLAGGWRVQGNDLITVLDRVEKINQRKR